MADINRRSFLKLATIALAGIATAPSIAKFVELIPEEQMAALTTEATIQSAFMNWRDVDKVYKDFYSQEKIDEIFADNPMLAERAFGANEGAQ